MHIATLPVDRTSSLPVVRNSQLEFPNMGGVFGEDDIARELGRRKPERKIWRLIELEFSMDPGQETRISLGVL